MNIRIRVLNHVLKYVILPCEFQTKLTLHEGGCNTINAKNVYSPSPSNS